MHNLLLLNNGLQGMSLIQGETEVGFTLAVVFILFLLFVDDIVIKKSPT